MKQTKFWIVTDTHFGHDAMEYYCGRPVDFSSRLMGNLGMIPKEDILIHLGDICIGNDSSWHEVMSENIKCRRILVRGNHDSKSNNWYLNHGWDFVCEKFVLEHLGRKIVFSHQPTILECNDMNIHGHFHNQLSRLKRREWVVDGEEERNHYVLKDLTPSHVNISMEELNYQAITLTEAIKLGKEQKKQWEKQ